MRGEGKLRARIGQGSWWSGLSVLHSWEGWKRVEKRRGVRCGEEGVKRSGGEGGGTEVRSRMAVV
jgi:hypothetical protein